MLIFVALLTPELHGASLFSYELSVLTGSKRGLNIVLDRN